MMRLIAIIAAWAIILSSCIESGKLKVQNKVHNVRLENIGWGEVSVYHSLLPGQTSKEVEVSDLKSNFPKTYQVEFYMIKNDKSVYLKTKDRYQLDYNETLLIVIDDSTEVINPLLE